MRIAIFNISYIRGLFPEKYFNDKSVPALGKLPIINDHFYLNCSFLRDTINLQIVIDMKIKKLMPMDAESRRLIDWMEKGI